MPTLVVRRRAPRIFPEKSLRVWAQLLGASERDEAYLRALSGEFDPALLCETLLQFAKRLEDQEDLSGAGRVYQALREVPPEMGPSIAARSQHRLVALMGQGSFWQKAEGFASKVVREASDPATILAMGVGGVAFRTTHLSVVSRLAAHRGANLFASASGLAAETFAFNATGHLANAVLGRTQDLSFTGLSKEVAGTALMLGSLRSAGALVGGLVQRWVPDSNVLGAGVRAFAPQAAMYGGILAAHELETRFGLHPRRESPFSDALSTLVSFNVGGRVAHFALGQRFHQIEEALDRRSNAIVQSAVLNRSRAWSGLAPALGALSGLALLTQSGRAQAAVERVREILPSAPTHLGEWAMAFGALALLGIRGGPYRESGQDGGEGRFSAFRNRAEDPANDVRERLLSLLYHRESLAQVNDPQTLGKEITWLCDFLAQQPRWQKVPGTDWRQSLVERVSGTRALKQVAFETLIERIQGLPESFWSRENLEKFDTAIRSQTFWNPASIKRDRLSQDLNPEVEVQLEALGALFSPGSARFLQFEKLKGRMLEIWYLANQSDGLKDSLLVQSYATFAPATTFMGFAVAIGLLWGRGTAVTLPLSGAGLVATVLSFIAGTLFAMKRETRGIEGSLVLDYARHSLKGSFAARPIEPLLQEVKNLRNRVPAPANAIPPQLEVVAGQVSADDTVARSLLTEGSQLLQQSQALNIRMAQVLTALQEHLNRRPVPPPQMNTSETRTFVRAEPAETPVEQQSLEHDSEVFSAPEHQKKKER